MNKQQFQREKAYGAALTIARTLLERGLITRHEYRTIKTMLIRKYRPVIGSLQEATTCNPPRNG